MCSDYPVLENDALPTLCPLPPTNFISNMATAMHSADHARMIADTVAKFRRGEMVDDLVFPMCAACIAPQRGTVCLTFWLIVHVYGLLVGDRKNCSVPSAKPSTIVIFRSVWFVDLIFS